MAEILDIIYRLITREQMIGYKDSSSPKGLESFIVGLCDKEITNISDDRIGKMLDDMKQIARAYGESSLEMRERKIAEMGRILLSLRDEYHQLPDRKAEKRRIKRTDQPDSKEIALNHKQEGRFAEAIVDFEKILESKPNDDFSLSHLSHIYFQQRRFEEANRLIDQALKVNPSNPFANTIKGEILFAEGALSDSAISFEEVINISPDDIYAHSRLGVIYRKQGKLNEAISILNRGLEIEPNDPSLHHALGDVYSELGRDEEAVAEFQKAMDIDPEDDYAFRGLVSRKSKDKDTKTAISQLQKVLKIPSHSQNPHLHALLATYLRQEMQYDEAVTEMREALRIKPDSIYFQTQLAFCYSKLEQYERVIELLEPINRIRPQDTLVIRILAKAYMNTDRIDEARKLLIDILYVYPNDRSLRMMLMEISKAKVKSQTAEADNDAENSNT